MDYSYITASLDVTNKVNYKNKTRSTGFLYRLKKNGKEDFVKVALTTAFHNFASFRKTK